jgi:hypothetical protein
VVPQGLSNAYPSSGLPESGMSKLTHTEAYFCP